MMNHYIASIAEFLGIVHYYRIRLRNLMLTNTTGLEQQAKQSPVLKKGESTHIANGNWGVKQSRAELKNAHARISIQQQSKGLQRNAHPLLDLSKQ